MDNTEKKLCHRQSSNVIKENYRPREAAEYLACGLSTIWYWSKKGLLHPIKLSAQVTIFKLSDLDAFIEKGAQGISNEK